MNEPNSDEPVQTVITMLSQRCAELLNFQVEGDI